MREAEAISLQAASYAIRGTKILNDVTFSVREGETFALVGPSGCGKTTALRLISGLAQPNSGRVLLYGRDAAAYRSQERCVTTVWQNRALFPHMSVRANIEFGLRVRRVSAGERRRRAESMADRLRLGSLLERDVTTLSGGEQQRVALARAMVVKPCVLLLNEPLTGLDQTLRLQLQNDLRNLLKGGERTYVLVSHSFDDVLSLSDRMAVLQNSTIAQVGSSRDVWLEPAPAAVARIIGRSNVLSVEIQGEAGGYFEVKRSSDRWRERVGAAATQGGFPRRNAKAAYVVHPHNVMLGEPTETACSGRLRFQGIEAHEVHDVYFFEVSDGSGFRVIVNGDDRSRWSNLRRGEEVVLSWDCERAIVVPDEED